MHIREQEILKELLLIYKRLFDSTLCVLTYEAAEKEAIEIAYLLGQIDLDKLFQQVEERRYLEKDS